MAAGVGAVHTASILDGIVSIEKSSDVAHALRVAGREPPMISDQLVIFCYGGCWSSECDYTATGDRLHSHLVVALRVSRSVLSTNSFQGDIPSS